MPNEPGAGVEPTTEELSAYLDHELDARAQSRVAEHVASCSSCQTRLDGLRQTAHAIRALPMETPPRSFTIPEAERRSFRWAPVGWVGGVAAAVLIVLVGVQHLPGPATSATTAGRGEQYSYNQAPQALNNSGQDRTSAASKAAAPASNTGIVIDPRNSQRRLTVTTDRSTYPSNGTVVIAGYLEGDTAANLNQVHAFLRKGSYAVELKQPSGSGFGTAVFGFHGSYALTSLPLPSPATGDYVLTVTWTAPDGATLIAEVPLRVS
jgi:Putative zinc-finger